MAIVKMDKFTLLTFHRNKNALLKELQKFGDVHFKRLKKEELAEMDFLRDDFSPEQTAADESELENVSFAISKIAASVPKPKGLKSITVRPPKLSFEEFDEYINGFDYKTVCKKVKEQDDRIGAIKSEVSKLSAENENLKAWLKLDAAPRDFAGLTDTRALLGTVNKMAAESFRMSVEGEYPDVYIEFLGVSKDDAAVFMLLPAQDFDERFARIKELGFSRAGLTFDDVPSAVVSRNKERVEKLGKEQREAAEVIASFVPEYEKLNIISDYFKTRLERQRARENFLGTESVVLIEGWVATEQRNELNAIIARVCGNEYYLESAEVEKDDEEVPVKLKNNRFVSAFEDVTTMYAMPKYGEIDPTPLLTPFYWFFFGFMVGDTGFGLVLMLGTWLVLRYGNFKEGMRRFITFFFYCSFAVMIAGVVYGSFFGFTFFAPIKSAASDTGFKPILDAQLDIPTMLILSIAVGLIQVVSGLVIKGYLLIRDGKMLDAVFDALFWIVTLLGGVVWLACATGGLSALAGNIGKWCFFGGLIGLALTQGRGGATIVGKIGTSVWEVYGISGYVGDLVSYTRIVALALSGAYIGFSFIQMSTIMPSGILGKLFGFIIILLGQTLNFGLGLLGAYVHTCRLQYVEFFGKFFEGGGIPFKPLKAKNDYVQITK